MCGSFLLLVGQETENEAGQYSPVYTSIYNCSNPECQKDFEKQILHRKKVKEEQDLAREKRIENNKLHRAQAAKHKSV